MKRFIIRGRVRRGFLAGIAVVSVVGASLLISGTVLAVHDTGFFELDGNAVASTSHDWNQICFQATGNAAGCGTSTAAGATAAGWTADKLETSNNVFVNDPNATIFTGGGSKDPQDINQWAWKDGAGGLPDKDNLSHSFAARYSEPSSTTCPSGTAATCELLYFGSDRFDNSGDAQQGFWFFQNKVTLGNTPLGGGTSFNGVHQTGDLLIISDFSNGGTTSTISIYKWNPAVSGNLQLLQSSSAANCATAAAGDAFCGLVNAATITMPWQFLDKSGTANNGALNGEFYEGGVNLSQLGLSGECFASFASETRSSTSTTATLKDFVLGNFGNCTSGTSTTPSAGKQGTVSIGTGASLSETDQAQVTVAGSTTFGGSVTFSLCGPTPLSDATYTLCTTGGTTIGAAKPVSPPSPVTVTSDAATVTSVGRYCWRADYSGDSSKGVPGSSDSSIDECFSVLPLQPSLPTTASGTVEIGNPISDSAALSGTANEPGTPVINPTTIGGSAKGSITFKLYGPNDATCATTPVFTKTVNVNGDATYSSTNFTPTAAGTYRWVASYTGDSPNTLGVPNACNNANESVVVTPKQPTISTQVNHETTDPVSPGTALTDTATLGNSATPSNGVFGTITFRAYGPAANTTTCTAPAIYTSTITVTGNGDYLSSNGSGGAFAPTAPGNYNWIASYTPGTGDVNNLSATTACGDAHEGSVVIQLQPSMTTAQRFVPNDSATVTVASGAGDLAGNVDFKLFVNSATCQGSPAYDSGNIDITTGTGTGLNRTVSSANTTAYAIDGTAFSWLVTYTSSNGGHKNVTATCNAENSSIAIANGGTFNTP